MTLKERIKLKIKQMTGKDIKDEDLLKELNGTGLLYLDLDFFSLNNKSLAYTKIVLKN